MTENKQRQEGYDAFMSGKADFECPYEIGTDEAMSWNDGWHQAAEDSDLGDDK